MNYSVFNIQHFSIGDGPGIRTTVFFDGCPLRCPWCHNPECFDTKEERGFDEVIAAIEHDIEFYDESGGGVTISGGEPLMHIDQALSLLRECKSRGICTTVDTALAVKDIRAEELVGLTDLFLVDIKTADAEKFARHCRGDLALVEENTEKLLSLGAEIIFRVPLIPGFNCDDDSLDAIADKIAKYNRPFSLLGYHRLGSGKYKNLGMTYELEGVEPLEKSKVEAVRQRFIARGLTEARL